METQINVSLDTTLYFLKQTLQYQQPVGLMPLRTDVVSVQYQGLHKLSPDSMQPPRVHAWLQIISLPLNDSQSCLPSLSKHQSNSSIHVWGLVS